MGAKSNETVFIRDRKGHTETQGRRQRNTSTETAVRPSQSIGTRSHQKLEETRKDFPLQLAENLALPTPSF